jgi:PAS domain S-box-containing protein
MEGLERFWFEELFDSSYHYVWILDLHGKVTKANRAALELAGTTENSVVGIPFWLLAWPSISSQDRKALKLVSNQALGGNSAALEFEIKRRGLPVITLSIAMKPVLSVEHELQFIFVEGHDITMYRRTSDALTQSEARFKTIFQEIGVGILIKGINGRMLDCNPAFESMLGYTAGELSRFNYLKITHPEDKRLSRKLFNELVKGKRHGYSIEKRYVHKNGHPVWTSVTASLVLGPDRQAQFVILMVENITLKKEIENELKELQNRLMRGREMERLKIAQDLHDGPLQELIGISFQVKGLHDPPLEAPEQEQLENIQAAIDQLVGSLRTICGELRPPTLVPFGLEKTIKSHAQQFQEAHPELAITLDLVEDGQTLSEPVRIVLFRIYQEALNNILRHAQARQVKVRLRLQGEYAVLKIQDNGKGFELPERWINLARQGHLGIVGARERAREIGGNLEISSRPGKGTVLRAVVPIRE